MNSFLPICTIYEEKCTSYAKEKIKVLDVYNIIFSFNISYFFHYYIFNSLCFDMAIKPSFEVQKIALIKVKYN